MTRPLVNLLINIDVPDLEQGMAFYRDGLGLELKRRLFDGSVAEMHGAAVPVYLLAKATGTSPATSSGASRDYSRHWTPVHLDIVVTDIERALARATAAGARCDDGIRDFAWGRLALLADPFGHGCCLLQWSGRGYDEDVASGT